MQNLSEFILSFPHIIQADLLGVHHSYPFCDWGGMTASGQPHLQIAQLCYQSMAEV